MVLQQFGKVLFIFCLYTKNSNVFEWKGNEEMSEQKMCKLKERWTYLLLAFIYAVGIVVTAREAIYAGRVLRAALPYYILAVACIILCTNELSLFFQSESSLHEKDEQDG